MSTLPDADKPPVARVLSAGAKGAERMAHVAGVDRALNQAAEEAIVRALRSPTVIHAIARAIETQDLDADPGAREEIAKLVRSALQTEAAGQAWKEVLESEQAQMLVERIAEAPEIRAAIASQSAGLITDIGVRLTVITEELDDAIERVTRSDDPDSETDQAGLVTRAVAGAIDLGLLFGAYALVSSVLGSLVSSVFAEPLSLTAVVALAVFGVVVGGAIFAGFWSLAGQTPGMRFLAIRLVRTDGSRHIRFWSASRRVLAVIVSLLPLGLGYLAILWSPQRRSWADRMTGTEVIYDLVARSAPYAGADPTSAAAARHRHRKA